MGDRVQAEKGSCATTNAKSTRADVLAVKEQLVQSTSAAVVQFNPSPDPIVSVIIVATGAAPDLLGCLRALAVNTKDVPFEVIVVENGVDAGASRTTSRSG